MKRTKAPFIRSIAKYQVVECADCRTIYNWQVSPHFCVSCGSDHNSRPIVWLERLGGWFYVPLVRDQKPLNQVGLTVQAVNGMLERGII